MFSLLKIKHTKQLIVVKSSNVSRKKKKDYWIKLDNEKRCVGIFLCKSDERQTLLEIKKNIDTNSPKVMIKNELLNTKYANNKTTCNEIMPDHSKIIESVVQSNTDTSINKPIHDQLYKENDENINPELLNVQYVNATSKCNINKELNFSMTEAEIQNHTTDTNIEQYDLLGMDTIKNCLDNEQIDIINDGTLVLNTDMINQFQPEDFSNVVNSYLELESDLQYTDETNVMIDTNLVNHTLDESKSSKSFPRIIENQKCTINMIVLPKSMDSTTNSSFNISSLKKSVNFLDTNTTDTKNSTNFSTSLINNNSKMEMIYEKQAENKSVPISICGDKEEEVDNSFIVNNNSDLYCNNLQTTNISQNTDSKNEISTNVSYDKDSDYEPSIHSESSNNTYTYDIENGQNCEINDLEVANESDISQNCSESANENNGLVEYRTCKDDELSVELSRGPKGDQKSNFCFYCNTMQTKIARHLELKHKNEEEVKKFLSLPKKSRERREVISQIRKKGNFKFNTQADVNSGSMIVVRRPTKSEKQCGSYFLPCSNCKGHYAIHNLRHHYRICAKKKDTVRNILKLARSAAQSVHNRASMKLRKDILPVMRHDNIYNLIKYDLLIILYGNYLCQIHRLQHLGDHIRQQLRLVGRFLEAVRSIEPKIEELQMLFDPKYYDIAIEAVNIVAKYNKDTESYEIPYNATTLGTCLKKLCKILINEFIKQHEYERQKLAKNFLKILEVEYGSTVNKTVAETKNNNNRKKIVNLPKTSDIKKLTDYLEEKRISCMREIKNEFTFHTWKSLAETILIIIQVFNRRRAGEIERAYIVDYKNSINITEKDELYKKLPEKEKKSALKYIRFIIRGKLNRNVPVILNTKMKETIEVVLKYRKLAGVSSKNPYIFGLPGTDKNRFMYLRASKLMREFSNACGAENKKSLRGTILRKDMATKCANLPDTEISRVADFMGHHKDIHKNIYRQPVPELDILNMAQILEKTQDISACNTTNSTNNIDTTNTSIISDSTRDINTSENSINKIQSTDETESATLPHVTNSEKTLLRQKNINNHTIKRKSNSGKECTEKRKRCTPPYGKTRRIRWTEEEQKTGFFLFGKIINKFTNNPSLKITLPPLKEISLKTRNTILKHRRPAVIKTWIYNQISVKRKKC